MIVFFIVYRISLCKVYRAFTFLAKNFDDKNANLLFAIVESCGTILL